MASEFVDVGGKEVVNASTQGQGSSMLGAGVGNSKSYGIIDIDPEA